MLTAGNFCNAFEQKKFLAEIENAVTYGGLVWQN